MMNIGLLVRELVRDEGLRLSPYRCTAGKLTTGVGRNLDGNPMTAEELGCIGHDGRSKPITKEQAHYLLVNDIYKVSNDLDRSLPWWQELDDTRKRVLANMCFNMGIGTLLTFKNTLHLIHTARYFEASKAMLRSKWASQVGARASRLAKLMADGTSNDNTASVS